MLIKVRRIEGDTVIRFAITKKVLKRAVDRNLLRRRIKGALLAFSVPSKGMEITFVPSSLLSFAEIEEILKERLPRWKIRMKDAKSS